MKFEKIKKIFLNKYSIIAALTILALFVRLLNIDIPGGFWYDEMMTYIFSSKEFPFGILKTLWQQEYHMPFYYLYLSLWMKFFGTSDIILRFSSIFFGALTIPALYFLGKAYKSEKLGYLLAALGCLSPILIYYSQEFRFYSMLFFFSTLSIYFFLRLINTFNKKDTALFYTSNLIILYIYTMGIIFVAVEVFVLFLNYYLYNRKNLTHFIKYSILPAILTIPYFILLISFINGSNNAFVDPLGWGQSSLYSIIPLINDWFTPFLTSIYGQQIDLINNPSIVSHLLFVTPIYFITGFILGLRKADKNLYYLLTILFSFLIINFILCSLGYLVLISKYTIIVLPIIFLICMDGLLSIKTKCLKYILISLLLITFAYSSIYKNIKSPTFRPDGIKQPAEKIMQLNPNGDYLIATEGTNLFQKYTKGLHFINFDSHKIIHLDKTKKENLKVFDKNFVMTTNKYNSDKKLATYFLSSEPTNELETFVDIQLKSIPQSKRLIHVEGPNYYEQPDIRQINEYSLAYAKGLIHAKDYKNSLFYLLNQKINLDLKTALRENSSLAKEKEILIHNKTNTINCSWIITVYRKK